MGIQGHLEEVNTRKTVSLFVLFNLTLKFTAFTDTLIAIFCINFSEQRYNAYKDSQASGICVEKVREESNVYVEISLN